MGGNHMVSHVLFFMIFNYLFYIFLYNACRWPTQAKTCGPRNTKYCFTINRNCNGQRSSLMLHTRIILSEEVHKLSQLYPSNNIVRSHSTQHNYFS